MPSAQHPRAAFEPISPDIDVGSLVESTPNFEYVVRISCESIDEQGIEAFEKLVLLHVVLGGKPLVIDGYQDRLEKWIFSWSWLKDNHGTKNENARDLTSKSNLPLTIRHYLKNMPILTDQWNATNYKEPNRQRIYLKDIDCPPVWFEKLKDSLPPFLLYLNESTGNAESEAAYAGDLMSSLPPHMRAENLMCYIGHEGTYTPSHREMCATLGHNIMVEATTGAMENGKQTVPGSSIWFMTESKDRHLVSEYWLSALGHDIEIEDHFAQINAWKAAPFKTYIVEQKVGDFILIPPLAPHQVWNRGTRTMKVAWNRTTLETLEMALNEALPKARMVCRDEQYKNKAIVYYTLLKYSQQLAGVESHSKSRRVRQLQKDFRRLFNLFNDILLSESFSPDLPEPKKIEYLPFSSNVICSYCRCNIFNRFLTCPSCVGKLPDGDEDCYDICMECYALGRSCACISKHRWVEQFRWKELLQKHEAWRTQIINFQGRGEDSSHSQLPFHLARERLKSRTLAEICLAELKRRPWVDVSKPSAPVEDDKIVEVNDDGQVRKRRKIRRSETWRKQHASCHICKTPEPVWKLASCTDCGLNYCYGSLFRAFDISPPTILENPKWKCPRCRKICSCGACRRDPEMKPFEPTGTLLGHDTRKVADPRSVESLVDFRYSNLGWLKKAGDHSVERHDTRRLKKKLEEAEKAKSDDPTLEDHYADHNDAGAVTQPSPEHVDVDPALAMTSGREPNGDALIDPALLSGSTGPGRSLFVRPEQAVFQEEISDRYQNTEAVTFEYANVDATPSKNLQLNASSVSSSNPIWQTSLPQGPPTTTKTGLDGTTDTDPTAIVRSDITALNRDGGVDDAIQMKGYAVRPTDDEDFHPRKESHSKPGPRKHKRKQKKVSYLQENGSSDGDMAEVGSKHTGSTSSARRSTRLKATNHGLPRITPFSDAVGSPQPEDPGLEGTGTRAESPVEVSDGPIESPSKSPNQTQRRAMTEAEKNRQAKIQAMRWAEGSDDAGLGDWGGSDDST